MLNNNIILLFILISLNIIFITVGYILGKINKFSHNSTDNQYKPQSFISKQKNNNDTKTQSSIIDIDDTKVVVAIKTDGIEKKYSVLGNTQTSNEDISQSVNKLKNMKG